MRPPPIHTIRAIHVLKLNLIKTEGGVCKVTDVLVTNDGVKLRFVDFFYPEETKTSKQFRHDVMIQISEPQSRTLNLVRCFAELVSFCIQLLTRVRLAK